MRKEFDKRFLRHYDWIARYDLLEAEEEQSLSRRARSGDPEARDRLVLSNMKMVILIAKKFRGLGLSMDELISEGLYGLIRAVDKFDPERGIRFFTYAKYDVKGWIIEALRHRPENEVSWNFSPQDAESELDLEAPAKDPDDAMDFESVWGKYARFLSPEDQTIVQRLHGLDGESILSLADLSEIIGIGKSTVHIRYVRAIQRLRGLLENGPKSTN